MSQNKYPDDSRATKVAFAEKGMKIITDDAGGGITYAGHADRGSATSDPVWQIIRYSEVGNITTKEFADGDMAFDNIWDNRAALSYS